MQTNATETSRQTPADLTQWEIWYDGEWMADVWAQNERHALGVYLRTAPYVEGLEVYPA